MEEMMFRNPKKYLHGWKSKVIGDQERAIDRGLSYDQNKIRKYVSKAGTLASKFISQNRVYLFCDKKRILYGPVVIDHVIDHQYEDPYEVEDEIASILFHFDSSEGQVFVILNLYEVGYKFEEHDYGWFVVDVKSDHFNYHYEGCLEETSPKWAIDIL